MNFPQAIESKQEFQDLKAEVLSTDVSAKSLQELVRLASSSSGNFSDELTELLTETTRRYRSRLTPQYHAVPWGELIVEQEDFAEIYERTVDLVEDFSDLTGEDISSALRTYPRSLMVFRLIVGYTWSELADIIYSKLGKGVGKSKLKEFEQHDSLKDVPGTGLEEKCSLVGEAIAGIVDGSLMALPEELDPDDFRSRQFKVDTERGWGSVDTLIDEGVSYADLLYERYTGRPFAYVRDAMSEKKGDILENALEVLLQRHNLSYDRIMDNDMPGFAQAADYAIPDRKAPRIVVEAKLAADGGTARDKASRIERLMKPCKERGIILAALVDGKGFRRFNDVLLPIVKHTNGHTYFLENIEEMLTIPFLKDQLSS